MNKLPRISEFDGLRALLAWWVVASHLLYNSGFGSTSDLNIILQILRKGRSPVDVFIILSGFVIFFLLTNREEKYKVFILRRFFRLYPVYIVCFFLSVLIAGISIENMHSLPWSSELVNYISRRVQELHYIWQHISAHALMLHGIFPNELLPDSTNAFLSPAWSISLEWQFYLIAPVVFILLKRSPVFFLIISGVVILFNKFAYLAGHYPNPGFIVLKAELFWLGGATFYVFKYSQKNKDLFNSLNWSYLVMFLVCLEIVFINDLTVLIPLVVWSIVFGAVLVKYSSVSDMNNSVITRVLNNKYLRKLGEISYSTYLSHVPVIIMCQYFILKMSTELSKKEMLLMLTFLAVPLTIIISFVLNRTVEKPFMNLGYSIAKKWRS